MKRLQDHSDSWTRVDAILERSKSQQTKFFALQVSALFTACDELPCRAQAAHGFPMLQILEAAIKFRWGALPPEQREGIRNYVSNLIIKLSTDEAVFRAEKVFLNKLNLILVEVWRCLCQPCLQAVSFPPSLTLALLPSCFQILKHDWPSKWVSFIPDVVAASKTSETLCENSMVILKLLSEEVFDFSRGELTQVGFIATEPWLPVLLVHCVCQPLISPPSSCVQAKTKELKNSLNNEFRLIHELCLFVLNASNRGDLIRATLSCLHAYLSWIPLGYIFESNLIEMLLKIFPQAQFRNITLQCLAEVRPQSADALQG